MAETADKRRKNHIWQVCDDRDNTLDPRNYQAGMLAVLMGIRDRMDTAAVANAAIIAELHKLNALLHTPGLNMWGADWLAAYIKTHGRVSTKD